MQRRAATSVLIDLRGDGSSAELERAVLHIENDPVLIDATDGTEDTANRLDRIADFERIGEHLLLFHPGTLRSNDHQVEDHPEKQEQDNCRNRAWLRFSSLGEDHVALHKDGPRPRAPAEMLATVFDIGKLTTSLHRRPELGERPIDDGRPGFSQKVEREVKIVNSQ